MAILSRIIRFAVHEGPKWPLITLAVMGFVLWRYHDLRSLSWILGGSALGFALPYFARYHLIRNYAAVRYHLLVTGAIVMAIAYLVLWQLGYKRIGTILFGTYYAFALGVMFWCVSDRMYEMISWLAFPTEYGRLPDEIYLVDKRKVTWPDEEEPITCCLFRFRYDDTWDYGITGPLTFSLGDQDFEGKSLDEIYAAYAEWYSREGIGRMIDEEVDRIIGE